MAASGSRASAMRRGRPTGRHRRRRRRRGALPDRWRRNPTRRSSPRSPHGVPARPAHRRPAGRRRQPRGRLSRAGRPAPTRRGGAREPAGLGRWRRPSAQTRHGAAPDRPPRRERAGHDRHPGRRPAVLRLGQRPPDGRRRRRSTSCCPGRSPWRSSRRAWSTSASRPRTSGTTASSSGSAARR